MGKVLFAPLFCSSARIHAARKCELFCDLSCYGFHALFFVYSLADLNANEVIAGVTLILYFRHIFGVV